MELLLPTIYYRFLNPVNPTARSMTHANIDTLSKKRYYIHFDVHPRVLVVRRNPGEIYTLLYANNFLLHKILKRGKRNGG